jgi:hypothetical protein
MPVRNLACQVSSRGDQFEGSQYLELTEVTSLEDLHNKLKTALSINLHESITVEAWDVDFDEWCQLHDVDVCPEKPNLRISRGIKIDPDAPHERRRFSKRDRSLSAREALPSPSYTKRFAPDSADQPQHHPQPKTVVYNGLMFVAGMPKRHTGQAQKNNKARPRRWTPEEDKRLLEAVGKQGARNWKGIAAYVQNRNHTQVGSYAHFMCGSTAHANIDTLLTLSPCQLQHHQPSAFSGTPRYSNQVWLRATGLMTRTRL